MATHITLLTMSLIFFSFLYTVSPSAPDAAPAAAAAAKFINDSCNNGILYPDVCVSSLAPYAWKIKRSPRLLAMMALSVSLKWAKEAYPYLVKVGKYHELTRGENASLSDCLEQVRDTVSQLSDSAGEMKSLGGRNNNTDFEWHLSNLQTWVSAAITNENTCLDGLREVAQESDVRNLIEDCISKVVKVTSNALALCNRWGQN